MSSCQLTLVCVKQLSVCASESFPITANVPYDAVLSFGFRACTKKPRNCELSFPESVTARQTVFMSFIVSVIIINTKNCRLSIVLTATDQKPQKSLKRWYYPPSHRLNVNVIGQGMWILWGGGSNCPLPLTKPVAINTGLALPRSPWLWNTNPHWMKQRSFSRKRNEISSANIPRVLNRNPKVFTHVSVLTKDTAFPFLLQDLLGLHGFPRLFTVTSEHIPFFTF